jgi:hypothetical protein
MRASSDVEGEPFGNAIQARAHIFSRWHGGDPMPGRHLHPGLCVFGIGDDRPRLRFRRRWVVDRVEELRVLAIQPSGPLIFSVDV